MGNQLSHTKELGGQPNDKEIMIVYRVQKLLYTLCSSPHRKFEPISEFWKWKAGFSSCNPGDDLRSMGELGLRCLIYFVQNHHTEFTLMRRRRGGSANSNEWKSATDQEFQAMKRTIS
ncbi:unnamed protein product [Albugo candida]|uniref:ELMO domain-containing protein n=1 Tax=Albugo candida TaxID=65357 RepID=A0A024GE76_9STRA|nr:unnamed protein product [Albugo candida]|eukprot:CCI45068.1 unnamed protein product [Albugo candida]